MNYLKLVIDFITARDVAIAILFLLLGLISSWQLSVYFYEKSLMDSRTNAAEAERINQLILRGIESIGSIRYSRDSSGKILRTVGPISGSVIGRMPGMIFVPPITLR